MSALVFVLQTTTETTPLAPLIREFGPYAAILYVLYRNQKDQQAELAEVKERVTKLSEQPEGIPRSPIEGEGPRAPRYTTPGGRPLTEAIDEAHSNR